MARNTVLACIELATNNAFLAERTTYLLADLANGAVGIELLADCTSAGNY